jgi:tetratricopeptide (TPR) repeat protein
MATRLDPRGVRITADSAAEIASVDAFTNRLLRIDRGLEAIVEDAKTFPETPMVQLGAAIFCLLGQTAPADAGGVAYLAAAAPMLPAATEREHRLHHALTLWSHQDHLGAVAEMEDITRRWPRDLLSAKLAEFFYYVLGQQHEGPRFLRHMTRLAEANADEPDFLSMHAFAHELCGEVANAQRVVERSLALEPRNPWAHHCVAHIHLRQGDTQEALRLLESYLPSWITCGRFAHCHNAWHLAVAHLDTLNRERALELFSRHVWGITPDMVFEQVDAIALLWRLEMAGASVDHLWEPLAERAEAHVDEHYMPFLDAHFVYALARAGRSAAVQQLLARAGERAAASDKEAQRGWATVGRALIEACAALAQGDAARSARLLDPVMADITVVGGSDAQVNLFQQSYFCSLLRSGRKADATAYWTRLLAGRTLTELDRYRLGLAS